MRRRDFAGWPAIRCKTCFLISFAQSDHLKHQAKDRIQFHAARAAQRIKAAATKSLRHHFLSTMQQQS
jgi:hypothetical protein